VRWASVTGSTPDLVERDLLQPLWRVALALSASQTGDAAAHGESGLLHRWLRARIAKAVGVVTDGLDSRDLAQAVAELTCLLDDVVRLYLAYQPEGAGDVLDTLSRLLAPFVPHLAEAMHRLTALRAGDSVLLARWPMAEAGRVDDGILAQLAGVGLLAELGETARRHSGVEPQRRLPKGIVGRLVQPSPHLATSSLEGLLARALNVNQVEVVQGLPFSAVWRLALSPDSAPQRSVAASDIDASLASLEADSATALVTQLRNGLSVTLEVTGRTVTLLREEVETSVEALPGWAAAGNAGWVVSLQIG
jgi:isoleucyl-tRNA synthetase